MEKANVVEALNGKDYSKYITPYTLSKVIGGGVNPYRVGDVIISTNNEDPSVKFGGTWQLLCPGRTLVCININDSDFNQVRKTYGAKTHTLTVAQMPSHKHRSYFHTAWGSTVWDSIPITGYAGPNTPGSALTRGSAAQAYVQPEYGMLQFENTGGGQSHNIVQPSFVVYMWERVA